MIGRFLKRIGLVLLVLFAGKLGGEGILSRHLAKHPAEYRVRPRVVLGGCLLLLGFAMIGGTIAWNFDQFRTGFWPTATGVIEQPPPRRARSTRIQTDVICTYTVDGVRYTTNRLKMDPVVYPDIRYAIEDADRYPVGDTVPVAYNPRKPEFGILEPGYDLMANRFSLVGVCFAVTGLGCLLLQVVHSGARREPDPFKSPERVP